MEINWKIVRAGNYHYRIGVTCPVCGQDGFLRAYESKFFVRKFEIVHPTEKRKCKVYWGDCSWDSLNKIYCRVRRVPPIKKIEPPANKVVKWKQ